jgi:hypothetical protein
MRGGKMSKEVGFLCSVCNQFHDGFPMSFAASAPYGISEDSRNQENSAVILTEDWCNDGRGIFYVKGVLEIPILDDQNSLNWIVWVSLSEKNFRRTLQLWETEGRENEPPYFGWLCTSLPFYPETLNLKVNAETRPVGQRPNIKLEPTNHPLAVEQRVGIRLERVQKMAESLLFHPEH